MYQVIISSIVIIIVLMSIYCIKNECYARYVKKEITSMLNRDAQEILLDLLSILQSNVNHGSKLQKELKRIRNKYNFNFEILRNFNDAHQIASHFFDLLSEDRDISLQDRKIVIDFLKWNYEILKYISNHEGHDKIEFLTDGLYHSRLFHVRDILKQYK